MRVLRVKMIFHESADISAPPIRVALIATDSRKVEKSAPSRPMGVFISAFIDIIAHKGILISAHWP